MGWDMTEDVATIEVELVGRAEQGIQEKDTRSQILWSEDFKKTLSEETHVHEKSRYDLQELFQL